jgi:transposase-like protein
MDSYQYLRKPRIAGAILDSPHQGVSKDKITPYLRAFQLRRLLKAGEEALKTLLETAL